MISTILSIVLALFFLGLSYALGKKFLNFFSLPLTYHEHYLFSTVLGVSLFGPIFFIIGIFHLYFVWFFVLFFSLLILFFYKDIVAFFLDFSLLIKVFLPSRYSSFFLRFSFVILILFIGANFFFSLTPEIQWDSLVYHLTQAKIYAHEHAIVQLSYDYHTYMPKQFEILYVLGEIFGLSQMAKIFTFFFNLFLLFGIFFFARRYWNYDVALLTSAIFYTIPTLALYQSTTYNDIPVTLFLFYSCYSFILSIQHRKFLLFAWIFLGAATATKILMLSTLPFFLCALYFFSYFSTSSNCQNKKHYLYFFFDSVLIFLLVFLFLFPWLLLTYTQIHNPVFPFFYSTLGGDTWNSDLETYWSTLRADFGSGRSIGSLFLTPWHITMNPLRYGPVYGITPLFFIFLPLLVFFFPKESSLQKKIILFLVFFSLFYFIAWFFLASDIRYLFPLFPGLTLLSVIVFTSLNGSSYSFTRTFLPYVLIFLLLTNLIFFTVVHRNTVQVLFHVQDTDSYIHSYVQNYPMAKWVNANLPNDVLLFIANDDRVYFYDKPYIQGYPIIQGVIDYPRIKTQSEFRTLLLEKGVTHVVLTKHHPGHDDTSYATFKNYYNDHITMLWLNLVEDYGSLVTVQDDVFLYTLN